MAKQINISNDTVEMLNEIAGPSGSWSDKIKRVSVMSGQNGSYFVRQHLDTLVKIYPQFEELFTGFKTVILQLYQHEQTEYIDKAFFIEIMDFAIEGYQQHVERVRNKITDYEQKIYRNPIDK